MLKRPTGRGKKTSDSRYRAVSIVLPPNACDAAKALAGKRFLLAQAPMFPVNGCGAASCSCGYRDHGDRRKGSRRALTIDWLNQLDTGYKRRAFSGRRDEDKRSDGGPEGETGDYVIYVSR